MNTAQARALRKRMTDAEQTLWQRLRRKQIEGLRFRRQFPLGKYIVDFVCLPARLVVEVDGGQHAQTIDHDTTRDAWLNAQGFRVLRFWNNQVLSETDAVVEEIWRVVGSSTPSLTLPHQGGGKPHLNAKANKHIPPPPAGGGKGEG